MTGKQLTTWSVRCRPPPSRLAVIALRPLLASLSTDRSRRFVRRPCRRRSLHRRSGRGRRHRCIRHRRASSGGRGNIPPIIVVRRPTLRPQTQTRHRHRAPDNTAAAPITQRHTRRLRRHLNNATPTTRRHARCCSPAVIRSSTPTTPPTENHTNAPKSSPSAIPTREPMTSPTEM